MVLIMKHFHADERIAQVVEYAPSPVQERGRRHHFPPAHRRLGNAGHAGQNDRQQRQHAAVAPFEGCRIKHTLREVERERLPVVVRHQPEPPEFVKLHPDGFLGIAIPIPVSARQPAAETSVQGRRGLRRSQHGPLLRHPGKPIDFASFAAAILLDEVFQHERHGDRARQRTGLHLHVKMGHRRPAGIAAIRQIIPRLDPLPDRHRHRAF